MNEISYNFQLRTYKMFDTCNKSSQSSKPENEDSRTPKRSPMFDDNLSPPEKSDEDVKPSSFGDSRRQVRFLQAPRPPKKAPLHPPYRVNTIVSAAQLFENRSYLDMPAASSKRRPIPPSKPVGIDAASTSAGQSPTALADTTGTSKSASSASCAQENVRVPKVAQNASQTQCLRLKQVDCDDKKIETSDNDSASTGHASIHVVPEIAETTLFQESAMLVSGLEDIREMVTSLLNRVTKQHHLVTRESGQDNAMYRGSILHTWEVGDHLDMKTSQNHTGGAESRVLKREAEVIDGMAIQSPKALEAPCHSNEDSQLSREVSDILSAVNALRAMIPRQWSAKSVLPIPLPTPSRMQNYDEGLAVTRLTSETTPEDRPVTPIVGPPAFKPDCPSEDVPSKNQDLLCKDTNLQLLEEPVALLALKRRETPLSGRQEDVEPRREPEER